MVFHATCTFFFLLLISDVLSRTEPLSPIPAPTPPNTPRLARSCPNWTKTDPKQTETARIGHLPISLGLDGGGVLGMGGWGGL